MCDLDQVAGVNCPWHAGLNFALCEELFFQGRRYLTQMDEWSKLPKTKLVSRLQLGQENTEVPHMVEGRYIVREQGVNIEEDSRSLPSSVKKSPAALRTAVYRTGTERKHKITVKEGKMSFEYVLSRKQSPEMAQCETMIPLELKSDTGKKVSMIPVHEGCQQDIGTSAASAIDDDKETEIQTIVSEPSCHKKICEQQKTGTSHNKPARAKIHSYDRTEPIDDDVIKHILRLRCKLGWQTVLPPHGYVAEEAKVTKIQKIALKRPLLLNDNGEYVYCLRRNRNNLKSPYNPYDLQVVSANTARHNKEYWTVTASFVSKFSVVHKAEEMEIIPVIEWLCERQLYYMIRNLNVFSNVRMKKCFFTWKINVQRAKTTKSKTMMYKQLFFADELFLSCLLYIQGLCEDSCNINSCKRSEDNAIYLIKVDRSRTYSLDEFCEEQYQQNKEALNQLQAFREKVIEAIQNTFLKVAEMKGAQKLFQSVPADRKENLKYAQIGEWRQMMKRFSRFLQLVDKIFQELLRKLVYNAVQLLLELFKGSSNVTDADEKKNENLIRIYKSILVRVSGLVDGEYNSVGVSKELIQDSERVSQEPSFHSKDDKVLKPEIITVADIDKVLEDVKKQLEGDQEYAPVFEVNIGLRIPFENFNDRGNHQEDDLYSCEMQDDDYFSLTSLEPLKQRLKDDENLKNWTQSNSKSVCEELSESTKKQETFKSNSQGKTDLSADTEVNLESANKEELTHVCSSSFCTDIYLIPNRREFSKKLQGIVDGLENITGPDKPPTESPKCILRKRASSLSDIIASKKRRSPKRLSSKQSTKEATGPSSTNRPTPPKDSKRLNEELRSKQKHHSSDTALKKGHAQLGTAALGTGPDPWHPVRCSSWSLPWRRSLNRRLWQSQPHRRRLRYRYLRHRRHRHHYPRHRRLRHRLTGHRRAVHPALSLAPQVGTDPDPGPDLLAGTDGTDPGHLREASAVESHQEDGDAWARAAPPPTGTTHDGTTVRRRPPVPGAAHPRTRVGQATVSLKSSGAPLPPPPASHRERDHPSDEGSDTEEGPSTEPLPQSSSSSPDDVTFRDRKGPWQDFRAHQDMLKRVAGNLGLDLRELSEEEDPLFGASGMVGSSRVALPIHERVLKVAKSLWQTPASVPPTAKGAEKKYSVPLEGVEYLYTHPAPCSLVVEAVNQRERQGGQANTPKNKDAKKLDLFGRKAYTTASLQLRIANHQALLGRYNLNLWSSLQRLAEVLPQSLSQDKTADFMAVIEEGTAVAGAALSSFSDAADAASRAIASAIAMRRASWLQSSGLSQEAQRTIQDLPFDGAGLFADSTDDKLHALKDSRATLRSLGIYTPQASFHEVYGSGSSASAPQRCPDFPLLGRLADRGKSRAHVRNSLELTCTACTDLGLLINEQKSTLTPVQRIEFIGATLDATQARAFLPRPRFEAMAALINDLHRSPTTTVRRCLQLLGHMAACLYMVRFTRLRLRPLQRWLASVYAPIRHPLNRIVTLPTPLLTSLLWWKDPREVLKGVPFREMVPSVTLITDASDVGWGAHITGNLNTQGRWSPREISLHINVRELRAVRLAFKVFLRFLRGRVVQVLTDNTAAMFYMNRQGGAHSSALCQEAVLLWELAVRHDFHIAASHLPGVRNDEADRLSRSFLPRHDWSLRQEVVDSVFHSLQIVTLLSILSSSMAQVESYSRNFMKYCAMVDEAKTMNMKILALQRKLSSHDFRSILNKYTDDLKEIVCMIIERRIHMIKVRSINYQTDCLPYFETLLNIIRSSLHAIIEARNSHLLEVIHSALMKLDKDLTTVEEFIEHLTFLSQISSELPMLETQYNTLSQLYSIARDYDIFISAEQFALYQILTRSLHDLKSTILICEKGKNDNIIKFSGDLDGYIGNLQFELRKFKNKVRNPVLLLSKTLPKTAKEMIQSLVEEAAVISNKSRSYANYQDLFDSSIADMRSLSLERISQIMNKELSEIESELALRKILWDSLAEWGKLSFRWKRTLFENLDVDLIQKDVSRLMQTIQMLEKGLPENNIIIGLKQSLMDFKEGLSVIVSLRSPCLQPRHWEAIQHIIGQSISWDKKFTLDDILQLNLFQYTKEINDISVTATNEATLEVMLNKVINLWNKTNFHLSPHRSETSTVMIISSAEDIMAQLEESQVTISTIKGSCYVGPVKNLVDAWDHRLNLFCRTLEEWLTCQRNWIYLEPIFHAPEIQRQLPAEASLFSQVNNKWKEIMVCTEDDPNALRAATTAGVLEMLQTNNAHLEKIQKSLEDYLEIKRMIFPRFYFLSNAELLDILAESKNPEAVQPHLVKCFANIRKLYIRRHDQSPPVVVMISSAEEETLLVPKNIRVRGPVEQWLGNVESSMFDMVKKFVNVGVIEWNQMEFKQWFLTHPGQVVLLVSQIMFNKDCTRSFQSSDPKMELTAVHDELVHHLEQLAEMASDILQLHKQTTLEALLTLYIHCRDILSSLIDKQIFKREDFEWTRQLRYEWNEVNTTCKIVQGNASFVYGYEYLGCSSRLVITPLTDRCWLTLTGALHLNLGGCPAGPAGTGKTETVKDLSKAMGKLCVVFNCFEGLDYKMMGKFFCGLVQSGAWCCFDEFNRIDIEVLSVIASQIQTIKAAKDSHVIRFVLEGKEIRINTSCGIFITMNPGYKGRVELPDNLKSLFRPVSMMVPDYQLIAEVMLFSEGFKSAKSLSGKLVNLYQLASNQLSQQDHYDFGMRAIKTVLVRAGQKKKELKIHDTLDSLSPNQETLIIINSLKEANLPKFLAEDVPLFENIMADLFPGITIPRASTHRLEKAVAIAIQQLCLQPWTTQIEKILQFYNQILARVGVMLVGPTGGGKTTVRTILEKALVILPTVCLEKIIQILQFKKKKSLPQNAPKKGKVDTFVINPKCVSVGELYGQTDPNTMEWSDGLLASAVRTFAKSSTKKSKKKETNSDAATRIHGFYTVSSADSSDSQILDDNIIQEIERILSLPQNCCHHYDWQWIILDGPVDTIWIENLNTVLDDTRTLCLANSERIYLPSGIRMIFETDSLSQASPATVSRCAMVFVDPTNLGWEPYVKTWLLKVSKIITQSGLECLESLFEKSMKKGLRFLDKYKKMQLFPVQQMGIVMNICRILGAFIDIMSKNGGFCHSIESQNNFASTSKVPQTQYLRSQLTALVAKASLEKKREDQKWFLEKHPDKLPSLLGKLYVFAFTWAVGGILRREKGYEEETLIGINTTDETLVNITCGFSNFVRDIFEGEPPIGIQFPAGDRAIFEYFVDLQTGDFAPWTDLVPTTQFLIQQETTSFSDSLTSGSNKEVNQGRRDTLKFIPNMDTICYSFLTSLLLVNKHPVLIAGDSGIGKTAMIQNMLERLQKQGGLFVKSGTILGDVVLHNEAKKASLLKNASYLTSDMLQDAQKSVRSSTGDSDLKSTKRPYSATETDYIVPSERINRVIVSTIQCGAHTSAAQIQAWIGQKLILKSKDVLGAPKSKQVIVFIDDLNMPIPEEYGAQPPLESIRQFLDLAGFYDTKQLAWKNVQDISLIADCVPPSAGRNEISPRLLRHFCLLVLPQPSLQSLQRIFQVHLGTYLFNNRFLSEVQKCNDFLTSSSIAVYYNMYRSMLPTPAKCHYTFNLRDLFKVLQGLLQAHRSVIVSKETAALLFVHETTRVFHDRLTESAEREIFYQFLSNELHNYFQIIWTKEKLMEESTIFVDFLDMNTPHESKIYRNITDYKKLVSVLEEFQTKMMSLSFLLPQTSMVFFKEAVEHTTRAARVFRQPGGHMMQVGLDGNGKITCATLACYLSNCSLFRLCVTRSYSYTDFREDLKSIYRQTGLEGLNTVFLITDSDIVQESFLEHLSCILNSGEVLDLFDKEELEGIVVKLTAVAEKANYSNSRETILSFFLQRVRSKLHIVLATSPAGLNFRQLCRTYPAIVNCCTVDWYDNWPEEALLHVAKSYFSHEDICDDSENLTNVVAQVCVEIHKSVSTTTQKYLKETKRHYYITPNSYLQFIGTFSSILGSTKKKSLFNRACFYNGLTKLLEATSLVAEMQEELLALGPQIEQKSKEIEELMEKLHRDSLVVEQVQILVKQDEEIMAEETKVVEEYAQQATKELNAVLPALEKALAALDALDKAHIAELRVYTHPPPLVLTVMNAVCILLQKKPSWATAKLLLADPGFLKKLVTLDKDNLPEKVFLQLKRYVRSPDFSPSKVGLVSIACCSMCHWILALDHYHEVQKLVEPKQIRVTEAQEVLRLAHQKLDEKQRSLALIEEHKQNLEASYQESIAQKEMLATRKQLATQRLHRASLLSTALEDEMERWKDSVNNLDQRLQGIMGDALVSAACIIYNGVLSSGYRQQLVNECLRLCNENTIPVSANYSLITAMTEKNEVSKWQNEGLPLDQYSIENAILVKNGQRWPLLIDPQKQAYKWICQMEGDRLRQVHASDSSYLRTFENAVRIGHSILLQDLAETLDSNLKPILRKEIYNRGGKDFIRIGDAEIEYNHNFRLYMTTQKANPHFLPAVCNMVTMINFTVTFQCLQDQLLSTVVIHETPQLEQQRCKLLESISADQITLRELEQKSLQLLHKTEGHILDDQDLIDNLQRTKVTSKEIFERVEASAKTEATIEKTRKNYLPVATRGAVLYFVVADLIKINYMYQFSLEWFHKLFVESMDSVNKLQRQISLSDSTSSAYGTVRTLSWQRRRHFIQEHWQESEKETDSFNRHLQDIIDMLTNNVYKTVSSALFTENQLCFSFLLCTKIMQNNGDENQTQDELGFLPENEWNFFLYSSMLANIMDTQSEPENNDSHMFNKTPHLWITESMWKECQYMSTHMQPFNLLCESLASNFQQWSSFRSSDLQSDALKERVGVDSAMVDFHWENLSSFEKIILIKILKPESLNNAIREFVTEKLGARYLHTGGINLKEVYEDSTATTPLIFIHSHGIDPAAHLLRLAQEIKGSTQHVKMVSLGRGQGSKAEDLIHKAQLLSGQWVFIQNCHLAASFMPRLCTIVDSFTQPNINMDPQFRLWLSSTPDPSFPIPILQKGFKMAIEPPLGLKGKLLQTFGCSGSGEVTEIIFNKAECGLSWKKLVFSLCFFNAVVHEREKYGALGWNVPYKFNSSDLEVSIQMLGMLLANQEEIPWPAMCYLTGEVAYGGRVTDHWDRRCLLSILNNFYNPAVLQEGFAYSSDGVYRPVSATDSLQDCRAYLESLPDTDSPELFGMHACAGRAFLESQAQTFIDTIVSMQPGMRMDSLITRDTQALFMLKPQQSQDELVLEIASDILRQLPLTVEEQDKELTPGTEHSSKIKTTLGSLMSGPIWACLAKDAKVSLLIHNMPPPMEFGGGPVLLLEAPGLRPALQRGPPEVLPLYGHCHSPCGHTGADCDASWQWARVPKPLELLPALVDNRPREDVDEENRRCRRLQCRRGIEWLENDFCLDAEVLRQHFPLGEREWCWLCHLGAGSNSDDRDRRCGVIVAVGAESLGTGIRAGPWSGDRDRCHLLRYQDPCQATCRGSGPMLCFTWLLWHRIRTGLCPGDRDRCHVCGLNAGVQDLELRPPREAELCRPDIAPKPGVTPPESMAPPWFQRMEMTCLEEVKDIVLNSSTQSAGAATIDTAIQKESNPPRMGHILSTCGQHILQGHDPFINSALLTVLRQEIDRFNHLLSVIIMSLHSLQRAMKGEIILTTGLEELYNSVLKSKVPEFWQLYSYMSNKPLGSWIDDLILRVNFFATWANQVITCIQLRYNNLMMLQKQAKTPGTLFSSPTGEKTNINTNCIQGNPSRFWLSGFFFPQGFLTAVLQNYARQNGISVDSLTFVHRLLPTTHDEECNLREVKPNQNIIQTAFKGSSPPENGVLVFGLYIDGARWSPTTHVLEEPFLHDRFYPLPEIVFLPQQIIKARHTCPDEEIRELMYYDCPLYRTPQRAGILLSTGLSTNFVTTVSLPTLRNPNHWVTRGVAMLCQLDD
ncbi:dynein axonemal heavy chain 14 [Emydura macquarii macquarii]|uniref:dynein axonemal heavy chain 14 n=1 Tax=Emydura macquarii macquarii TaxID=1129001 RepID=UPI00352A5CA8